MYTSVKLQPEKKGGGLSYKNSLHTLFMPDTLNKEHLKSAELEDWCKQRLLDPYYHNVLKSFVK
ncbi:hypothetical protein [Cytobacillus gottheilii]|uniref:hypothetical protein n=1 Tax=Cytobacillus gottheilii TaxID=859144 RepID=UPI0009BB7F1D|nr:hypothetical protein [Cytobacillus gottheilii]